MRKALLLCILLYSFTAIAQDLIPNQGFEEWSGTPESPDNWVVQNYQIMTFTFISAQKSTDTYSGSYAMKLTSMTLPPAPLPALLTLPGSAVTGFACTDKPLLLKGYYKYDPAGTDTASISVVLTKWNGTSRDTIGTGLKLFRSAVSTYTLFSVPLLIIPGEQPDSAFITILSSPLFSASGGTQLFIDELSFYPVSNPAGIKEKRNAGINAFPNPATDIIHLDLSGILSPAIVKIYDAEGREVATFRLHDGQKQLEVSGLSKGIYLCRAFDQEQKIIATRKIILNP